MFAVFNKVIINNNIPNQFFLEGLNIFSGGTHSKSAVHEHILSGHKNISYTIFPITNIFCNFYFVVFFSLLFQRSHDPTTHYMIFFKQMMWRRAFAPNQMELQDQAPSIKGLRITDSNKTELFGDILIYLWLNHSNKLGYFNLVRIC